MVEKRSVTHRINRRAFVAGTSAALAMGMLESEAPSQTGGTSAVKLAIEGGEKAVTRSPGSGMRWGDRELKQLQEMLQQSSLFYWNGPKRPFSRSGSKRFVR